MSYALWKNTDCADAGRMAKHYSAHVSHSRPVQCGDCRPAGDLLSVEAIAAYTFSPPFLAKKKQRVANCRKTMHVSG